MKQHLITPTTIAGQRVADSWDKIIKQLDNKCKTAAKVLGEKRSTLTGGLFGFDDEDSNSTGMFNIEIRPEDRHAALQKYVNDMAIALLDIEDAIKRRNSLVRHADLAFKNQTELFS